MKLSNISIRNFRRLEGVEIDVEGKETIFVGPNNSGKTSATAIFRCFLGGRDFKIHDFSVARVADFEKFTASGQASDLPEISLDLWFTIDPNSIAFGRVFTLLPKLSDFTRVGLRLYYGIDDAKKLREHYSAAYPADQNGIRAKTLFQYLDTDNNLHRHSTVRYESLEEREAGDGSATETIATALDPEEGKRLVKHLIRVDFVDAQRNINDDDSSRSNRLSAAFASYYRKNLEQAGYAAEAHKVIDENNKQLTEHYEVQFKPLFDLIKNLSVNSDGLSPAD
jgi:predicted ATP-dependent endonuclease of OLD family